MRPIIKTDFTAKIAILYVIDKFGKPAEEEMLTEVATTLCKIDYFSFRQCVYELTETSFVHHYRSDGLEYYTLNEKGRQALDFFISKLPYSLRTQISEYIKDYTPAANGKNEFVCDYMPVNDLEYNVTFAYNEESLPILRLEFRAGDRQQAKELARVFRKNKERIYTELFGYVMKLANEPVKQEETPAYEDIDELNFFE